MHNQWNTITLDAGANCLILMNTVANQNVGTDWCMYFVSAADLSTKQGNIFKLGGTIDLTYNWNSGLSIGINVDGNIWGRINVLYL